MAKLKKEVQTSTKEVQKKYKQVQLSNLYLTIYQALKQHKSPSTVAFELGISKSRLQYYLTRLKKQGIIAKLGYGTWEVKKEVQISSLGTRAEKPITNLHALQINIPVTLGTINDAEWTIKEKLNHWIPKYKGLTNLGGLTVKNNNNKSITIFAKTRNIESLDEVNNLAFKIRAYAYEYFKKQGVILDVFNAQVKNLNLATEDKKAESMIKKGEKFELDLNKKSEKIFDKDSINGKAWIDGSPFKFSTETNDLEWKRAYLSMPFAIHRMAMELIPTIQSLNSNMNTHISVMKNIDIGIKRLNKTMDKLTQTKLTKYL